MLLKAEQSIFQLYHVRFVQEHHAYRGSWNFIVLAHWNNSMHVDMLTHSDTLTWFRAKQSLLLHLNAVYIMPWAWFELTMLVAIDTDYIGRCKSNNPTITITMSPNWISVYCERNK